LRSVTTLQANREPSGARNLGTINMPSLYANLLDPSAPKQGTISGAPVKYEFKAQAEAPQEEKKPADGTFYSLPQAFPT